ncbi:MAG TPA: aldo/keto reductase [Actinomycetota bacterium]|nr:aldo/keto reductase [Actinomycetota bacterium]
MRLGRTGLHISQVILGCGNFGGVGSAPELFERGESEAEATTVMDRAYELGINVFDTANSYGGGASEAMIGRWLAHKGPRVRDQIVIMTKVGNPVTEAPNDRGLSRRHILQQVDASLARLGVDAIDLYLLHECDPHTSLEETLSTFNDLIAAGKVCYIGASNIRAWVAAKALGISERYGLARFELIENSYNLLDRIDEDEMLPLVADQNLGYTPFGPFAGGFLAGSYREGESYPSGSRMTLRPEPYQRFARQEIWRKLDIFAEFARDRKVSMASLALAWLLAHDRVTAPIVGPSCESDFEAVRQALTLEIGPDEHACIGALFRTDSEY